MKKLLITADKSGSGKTMITCGILQALKDKGEQLKAFKCGPDYIDPMFHKKVLEVESENLDSFFMEEEQLKTFFSDRVKEGETAVIEGVMGYFDGLGGSSPKASASHIAYLLDCPVIFVADARKTSLSLAAAISGFMNFRPKGWEGRKNQIEAVILNHCSPAMYERLKEMLEQQLRIPVVGYVPEMEECRIESRHLGLVMPEEIEDFRLRCRRMAEILSETLDLDLILKISEKGSEKSSEKGSQMEEKQQSGQAKSGLAEEKRPAAPSFTLAVAKDRAFNFYYQENIRLLQEAGARILEFSPLYDSQLPAEADGLLLGGGYPELFGKELESNASMRKSIKEAAAVGMPVAAECGGFLYLLNSLQGQDGTSFSMAGVIPGESARGRGLGNFGYITVEAVQETDGLYLKKGEKIKGHEYHYWKSLQEGKSCLAKKPSGGKSWECIYQSGRIFAGFPHLYYASMPEFPRRIASQCIRYRQEKTERNELI